MLLKNSIQLNSQVTAGTSSGHSPLNRHLIIMRATDCPLSRYCLHGKVTAIHVISKSRNYIKNECPDRLEVAQRYLNIPSQDASVHVEETGLA